MKNLTIFIFLFAMINSALTAQNLIEGSISNEQGESLIATTVILQSLENEQLTKVMKTDEYGYFVIENMADGAYQLEVINAEYESVVVENFEFPRDSDQVIGLTLVPTEVVMPTAKTTSKHTPGNKLTALDTYQ